MIFLPPKKCHRKIRDGNTEKEPHLISCFTAGCRIRLRYSTIFLSRIVITFLLYIIVSSVLKIVSALMKWCMKQLVKPKTGRISAFPAAYSPRVNAVLLESLLSLPLLDSESTLTYFIPSRNPTAVILLLWSGKCGQTADARTGCREPTHARLP